jgi:hypothetical protein
VPFAVHQPNGKTGSVVADVEIPDYTKEPVILSGVVLSSERAATDRTLLGDEFLNRILGAEPTARRRFSQADTVTAFAEVYATQSGCSRHRARDRDPRHGGRRDGEGRPRHRENGRTGPRGLHGSSPTR